MARRRSQSKTWGTVAIVGAIAGAAGLVTLAARSKRVAASPRRIALIGDSYAVGLGPELAKLLPGFQYEGHVGTTTGQWASHAAACGECGDWLGEFRPSVVLVSLGVNDGPSPSLSNYQAIVRELHGKGARVVWLDPPAGVAAAMPMRSVVAELGVDVIPAPPLALRSDGVHPQSYAPWAAEIAKEVSRAGA
jgi:hypothetical protein